MASLTADKDGDDGASVCGLPPFRDQSAENSDAEEDRALTNGTSASTEWTESEKMIREVLSATEASQCPKHSREFGPFLFYDPRSASYVKLIYKADARPVTSLEWSLRNEGNPFSKSGV